MTIPLSCSILNNRLDSTYVPGNLSAAAARSIGISIYNIHIAVVV
jgi:hypothetical protein